MMSEEEIFINEIKTIIHDLETNYRILNARTAKKIDWNKAYNKIDKIDYNINISITPKNCGD